MLCAAYPSSAVFSAAPIVGALPEAAVKNTCGCNFQFSNLNGRSDATFLQWSYGEDAMMHIGGKLVRLKVKEVGGSSKDPSDLSV